MINQIRKILNQHNFFLAIFGLVIILALLPFYKGNDIILGGEGNYWLDFISNYKKQSLLWHATSTGEFSMSTNAIVFNVVLFSILQKLSFSARVINFILIFSIYFLPFLGFMLVSKQLKLKAWLSTVVSLFYVFNPFSLWLLSTLNQWNVIVLFVLPLMLFLILKYYSSNAKLFLGIGLASVLFSYANTNPPLLVVIQIALFLSVIITALEYKSSFTTFLKKYLIVLCSYILFNFWWIIGWIYFIFKVENLYLKTLATSGPSIPEHFIPVLWKAINLTMHVSFPVNENSDYFSKYFSSPIAGYVLAIPVLLVIITLLKSRVGEKISLVCLLFWLIFSLLTGGTAGFFGRVYAYLMTNSSIFSIFKTASEKWGYLTIFSLTLYFTLTFEKIRKDFYSVILIGGFIVYLYFTFAVLLNGEILPLYRTREITVTKRYHDLPEFVRLRNSLNSDKELYRVFNLPGSYNYQVAIKQENDLYYTGMDPVVSNTHKAYLAPYTGGEAMEIYRHLTHPKILELLGLYNVKKIVVNNALYPWFGFVEDKPVKEIETTLDKQLVKTTDGEIHVYDLGKYYLPRIYAAESAYCSNDNGVTAILEMLSQSENKGDQKAFFTKTDAESVLTETQVVICQNNTNRDQIPKISFDQVNQTKYVVKVENSTSPFLLVFGDTFDLGWEAKINGGGKIPPTRHLNVNGYANSWYIIPEDSKNRESYKVMINYLPQRLPSWGLSVSLLTFITSIVFILKQRTKE